MEHANLRHVTVKGVTSLPRENWLHKRVQEVKNIIFLCHLATTSVTEFCGLNLFVEQHSKLEFDNISEIQTGSYKIK